MQMHYIRDNRTIIKFLCLRHGLRDEEIAGYSYVFQYLIRELIIQIASVAPGLTWYADTRV